MMTARYGIRWHCQDIDGHNILQIMKAIEQAQTEKKRPSMILAHTIKGKGVPFMVGDNSWHKRVPTKEELRPNLDISLYTILQILSVTKYEQIPIIPMDLQQLADWPIACYDRTQ